MSEILGFLWYNCIFVLTYLWLIFLSQIEQAKWFTCHALLNAWNTEIKVTINIIKLCHHGLRTNLGEWTLEFSQWWSFQPGLGKYWKLNRSSRWRHYLTNFHRKKNWYLSRKLMTINEVLWINPDFRTMVVRYCVWWPEFLVSNILRCSATHVKANTRLERVRR